MFKKEMIAMLLAGGQGSRLGVLTAKVANRQLLSAGNTASLISHSATVSIQELIRLEF